MEIPIFSSVWWKPNRKWEKNENPPHIGRTLESLRGPVETTGSGGREIRSGNRDIEAEIVEPVGGVGRIDVHFAGERRNSEWEENS